MNPRARRQQRHGSSRSWAGGRSSPPPDARGRANRRRDADSALARPRRPAGSPPGGDAGASALDGAIDDLTARWGRGEAARAEDYVGPLPVADAAEVIYQEYCLAEAARLAPDQADYLRRFPDHAAVLGRLFSLHGALSVATLGRLATPAGLPDAGDEIGPYRLLRELGRGAFARVFLAEQADLGDRLVVVKVATRPSGEPALLARARHAHIVEVLRHADADDGALHLVCMPFLGGATLASVLDARRSAPSRRLRRPRSGRDFLALLDRASAPEYPATDLPRPAREVMARLSYPRAVAWMVARLAEALDHAGRRGVTHGDIKPSNILIAADGTPMLFDFNLAVDWQAADELRGADLGGTLAYMAPERLRAIADPGAGRAGDAAAPAHRRQPDRHRADLYALGLVLAEALTGEPPATPDRDSTDPRSFAASLADLRGRTARASPATRSRAIPPALRSILARCLAPDPGDRYARGGELAVDLDRWRSGRPPVHAPEPARAAWGRRARALRFPILAAALIAAVAGGVGLVATRVIEGTRRDQALAKWDYVLDHTEGVFKNRRFGQWQASSPGEPAEIAARHLARYDVEADPAHWRDRDDVRALPDRERGELEAWALEQVLRKAVALAERPDSRPDWERAEALLARQVERCPAAALRDLRAALRARLGRDDSAPVAPQPPAWLDAYLAGVAAEPLHARDALGHYLDALRGRPDLFWGHYRAAVVACRIDEYPLALEHLRACVARRPANEALRNQLGAIEFKIEQDAIPGAAPIDLGDAQAECDRALALNPDYATAHFNRTLIRQAAGQVESARADIDRFSILTRAIDPSQSSALRFLVRSDTGLNLRPHDATDEALLRQAILEDPTDDQHRMLLAAGLDGVAREAEVAEQYEQVLAQDPDNLYARYRRAVQNRDRDRDGTIAELARLIDHPRFEETFRVQPSMVRAYHHVATDLMKRGRFAEAEAIARRSQTVIRRSHALSDAVVRHRLKGKEELAPATETAYLLARINGAMATATGEPARWVAAIEYLREVFAARPDFRQNWFANDAIFAPYKAIILEELDRTVDR